MCLREVSFDFTNTSPGNLWTTATSSCKLQRRDRRVRSTKLLLGRAASGAPTTTNIESNKQELPVEKLPLTLQNAIQVAQKLAFSYCTFGSMLYASYKIASKTKPSRSVKWDRYTKTQHSRYLPQTHRASMKAFYNTEHQTRVRCYRSTSPTKSKAL